MGDGPIRHGSPANLRLTCRVQYYVLSATKYEVLEMELSRRAFVQGSLAATLGFKGLGLFASGSAHAGVRIKSAIQRFGALKPDPAGVLDLPDGFSYQVISRAGEAMEDGFFVPGKPDGMAAFAGPGGTTLLVRNHELDVEHAELGPFGATNELLDRLDASLIYDHGFGKTPAPGGVTTVMYNTVAGRVESQWLSLAGTLRNCAGGPTPWGSWITCEETAKRADGVLERDHGYAFEVAAGYEMPIAAPNPIRAMGRFRREAVAVDPRTGIIYQTEDVDDSALYRYIPAVPGDLHAGGRLQALGLRDNAPFDTRNWENPHGMPVGLRAGVVWIDLEEPESPGDTLRIQAFEKGGARFARGEGMWMGRGEVYFDCTSGGYAQKGQIWRYVPSRFEGAPEEAGNPGTLELFFEAADGTLIENADNMTMAPWGDLIVCEDGSGEQFLAGITPAGDAYKFARNARSESEMAGVAFSPDGTTLFVNIQHDGLTLAVRGPWRRGFLR